jgi:formylglycine-generating enzyme required for sulfatase activity
MTNLSILEFETVTVNSQGQEIKRHHSKIESYLEPLTDNVTLTMVMITGGTFLMGSPAGENGCQRSQLPQHLVTLRPLFMSRYPITQEHWQIVAKLPKLNQDLNPNPAHFSGKKCPVEQISWYDALEFCARLSQYTGHNYRLPSEAEWEYACRAATVTPFHFGETITTDLANYSGVNWEYEGKICSQGFYGQGPLGEDRRETTPVDYFQVANAWGLSDLHGNVREWCADHWHDNYENAPTDGSVWITGGDENKRVLRGGSWNNGPKKCRSAYRVKFAADASLYDIGFRVVYCQ